MGHEQLRPVELKLIDELFGMSSGYVLDFTNSTFADFFRREVGIDIYDNAYGIYGSSKGKHLRAFLTIGQPRAIAKALTALWEYRETDRLGRAQAETVVNARLRLSTIVERLGGVAYAHARLAEGGAITVESRNAHEFATGATARFGIDPKRAFLFDKEGQRI